MKNNKKITALTMALIAAFSMAGCGETGNTPETTTEAMTEISDITESTSAAGESETDNSEDIPVDVYDETQEEVYEPADDEVYTEVPEESNVNYVLYEITLKVGTKDEYDGVSFVEDLGNVTLTMDIPDYVSMDRTNGDIEDKKALEIMGAVWPAEQGFSKDGMKTDMVSGRTVTVYDEQEGEDGLYEYMLHSSVPDHYSESSIYETYTYIVKRGEYMTSISFLAEFYDKDIAERMLSSIEITESDTSENSQ